MILIQLLVVLFVFLYLAYKVEIIFNQINSIDNRLSIVEDSVFNLKIKQGDDSDGKEEFTNKEKQSFIERKKLGCFQIQDDELTNLMLAETLAEEMQESNFELKEDLHNSSNTEKNKLRQIGGLVKK